jgi:hypothetical protein
VTVRTSSRGVIVAVALAVALIAAQAASGAGAGSFAPTGDMAAMREGAAAAPLPDGRVLVAGGYDGATFLKSAEVFNPATNAFTAVNNMAAMRDGAAAAPLPDGRVLVAGGYYYDGADHYLKSAELYDPATGTFSATGDMATMREGAAAAPLPDGRVLVAGGFDGATFLKSAELFSLAKPANALSFMLEGKRLEVTVAVAGKFTVSDANARLGSSASAAKQQKQQLSLNPASATGGPGQITVKLKLAGKAKKKFKRTGKAKVRAKLAFAPSPIAGECVALFKPCYSGGYAATETATLKVKRKKHK